MKNSKHRIQETCFDKVRLLAGGVLYPVTGADTIDAVNHLMERA